MFLGLFVCLFSQKKLVSEAVKKDADGDYKSAVQLYCDALAFFVPAIHCKWYLLTLSTLTDFDTYKFVIVVWFSDVLS